MIDKLKKFQNKAIWLALIAVLTLLSLEFTCFNVILGFLGDKKDELVKLHAVLIVFLTLALVFVAWFQISDLNRTSRSDFLLRIDNHYGSESIIKARTIIHKFYCETLPQNQCIDEHRKKIADKILEISEKEENSEDFIYLLNFLDFLETIAYFANKNYISPKEIEELVGGSLSYYYSLYKYWISKRRNKYDDNSYYCEIEKFVNNMKANAF